MDIGKIERDLGEFSHVKGSEHRLSRALSLMEDVRFAEGECARDFSIPFDQVKRLRALIPVIEGHVSRLEAGKRRREKNKKMREGRD